MIEPFIKHQCDEHNLHLVQENLVNFVRVLENNPMLDGHFIIITKDSDGNTIPETEDIYFPAATARILEHRLNRLPRGWVICDTRNLTRMRRRSWDTQFITLSCIQATTAKIWVF